MKNLCKQGFIAVLVIIALSFAACSKVENARRAISAIQEMVENAGTGGNSGGSSSSGSSSSSAAAGSGSARGGPTTWTAITNSAFGSTNNVYAIAYGGANFVGKAHTNLLAKLAKLAMVLVLALLVAGGVFTQNRNTPNPASDFIFDVPSGTITEYVGKDYKVTRVPNSAFRATRMNKTLVISEGITEIGDYAFSGTGIQMETMPFLLPPSTPQA